MSKLQEKYQEFLQNRFEEGNKIKAGEIATPAIILVNFEGKVMLFNAIAKTKDAVKCAVVEIEDFVDDYFINKNDSVVVI